MHDALFSLQRAVVLSEEVGAIMKLPLWKPGSGSPAVTVAASGAAVQEQQPQNVRPLSSPPPASLLSWTCRPPPHRSVRVQFRL